MKNELNNDSKINTQTFEETLEYYMSLIGENLGVCQQYLEPPIGTHGMGKENLKIFLDSRTSLALSVIKNAE